MSTLKNLINRELKKQNLSRFELAQKTGYTNIDKGLRVIELFCSRLIDKNHIKQRLKNALNIPEDSFNHAVNETQKRLDREAERHFMPYIIAIFSEGTFPRRAGNFSVIRLSPEIQSLSYEQEIQYVFDRYKKQQAKYSNLKFMIGNGFKYYRNYKETLIFNDEGKITGREK